MYTDECDSNSIGVRALRTLKTNGRTQNSHDVTRSGEKKRKFSHTHTHTQNNTENEKEMYTTRRTTV